MTISNILHSEEEYHCKTELETYYILVGIIVANNKKYLLKNEYDKIKEDFWKTRESIILHSVKIRARKGAFAIIHYTPGRYDDFKLEMNRATKSIESLVICSSLNKLLWVNKYLKKTLLW